MIDSYRARAASESLIVTSSVHFVLCRGTDQLCISRGRKKLRYEREVGDIDHCAGSLRTVNA